MVAEGMKKMKGYKLVNQGLTTHGGYQWTVGEKHKAIGEGKGLCSDGFFHFYPSLSLAVLMNTAHANFDNPRAFECEVDGEIIHESLKSGAKIMTLTSEVEVPVFTRRQSVFFALRCAEEGARVTGFFLPKAWCNWAEKFKKNESTADEACTAAEVAGMRTTAWAAAESAAASEMETSEIWTAKAANAAASESWATMEKINFVALAEEAYNFERIDT